MVYILTGFPDIIDHLYYYTNMAFLIGYLNNDKYSGFRFGSGEINYVLGVSNTDDNDSEKGKVEEPSEKTLPDETVSVESV